MENIIRTIFNIGLGLLIIACMVMLVTNHSFDTYQYFVIAITMSVASILFLGINKTARS